METSRKAQRSEQSEDQTSYKLLPKSLYLEVKLKVGTLEVFVIIPHCAENCAEQRGSESNQGIAL